jgi:catechol 2,3-dioxygenase-like lactoylglutathione lyase family enzyme
VLHVVLDCRDPAALAPFWTRALGYRVAASVETYVVLLPAEGGGPPFLLQRVPEAKAGKNRMHVDLEVEDIDAEAAALTALGATRVSGSPFEEFGTRWITLRDPEGNEFDLCTKADAESSGSVSS